MKSAAILLAALLSACVAHADEVTQVLHGVTVEDAIVWPASVGETARQSVARGAYLTRIGGCFACHTDAKGGGAVRAGGAAIKTPFGAFYGPNMTTHETDGIGAWSLDDFAAAISDGGSRPGT